MAIQLIINREWGLARSENPNQGSFIIEELTDLVEEQVLREFERLSERGGVLGAMETGYQRGRIQDESLEYEQRKHDGSLPIVGVNTFLRDEPQQAGHHDDSAGPLYRRGEGRPDSPPRPRFTKRTPTRRRPCWDRLRQAVMGGENVFEVLMDAVRCCSLGQITDALFEVGRPVPPQHVNPGAKASCLRRGRDTLAPSVRKTARRPGSGRCRLPVR